MPSPGTGEVALEELARLLNVWLENDLVVTTSTALAHWAFQTAARSPRLPRPDLALPLLLQLGLATRSRGNTLRPTPRFLAQERSIALQIDRYTPGLAICVFEQLLTLPAFSAPLSRILSYVQVNQGRLSITWREISRKDQMSKGWLWLQQLGLMTHDGLRVVFDLALLPYVIEAPPTKRRLSQAELEERLELQRIRSSLAEQLVVEIEQNRLRAAGVTHFAAEVVRVSIDDVTAGYDIQSFEVTGSPRYIEVKSSAGPRQFFVLTRNEYDTARVRQASYWLAWVGWAARLPHGPCEVAWFQNPVALIEKGALPWELEEGDWIVQRVGDDNGY